MLTGGIKRREHMKKQAITKPVFSKIFAVRFLIMFIVFSIIALCVLVWLDDKVFYNKYHFISSYRDKVVEATKSMYEAEPGSEEYEKWYNLLGYALAMYQKNDNCYAEVRIGDWETATDEDTAFIAVNSKPVYRFYFIEDMEYIEPLDQFMDGKYNTGKSNDLINALYFDPLFNNYLCQFMANDYRIENAYINRETNTFIPGVITIMHGKKEYQVDCTPADTKGYEYVEDGELVYSIISHRGDKDLTSEDFSEHVEPVANGEPMYMTNSLYAEKPESVIKPWSIGFTAIKIDNVFKTAPITSALITFINLAAAIIVALILSFVKYQNDKTVWNIFVYRTRTTEAMAHDLKTPLASIMAYAENIESSADDPAKTRDFSRRIIEKVTSMDHMIKDILTLSANSSGNIVIGNEALSVMSVIKESLQTFPSMKTEISGDDMELKTDKKLFKQAIDNLLSNCDRYGDADSPVTIFSSADSLEITNKTSMTYDDAESLKQPFVKGDGARGNKGTGLGLSIADNNLNILGYKLELSSEEGVFKARILFNCQNKA